MATLFSILAWKIPWTGESVAYSPWGHKELDVTEHARTHCPYGFQSCFLVLLNWLSLAQFHYSQDKGGVLKLKWTQLDFNHINPSHNFGRFYSLAELLLAVQSAWVTRRKFTSIATVRAGIINWPGKRIPISNTKNGLNRTELCFF